MKISGLSKEVLIIGENIHATRVVLRNGKFFAINPDGVDSVLYKSVDGLNCFLAIPDKIKCSQDYEEGRVKHVKIALEMILSDNELEVRDGMQYLKTMVLRQEIAQADFLDLNVDEISLRLADQKIAMKRLVCAVQDMSVLPLSIDSSSIEIIEAGLESLDRKKARPLINSASLERLDALDLARQYDAKVIITAAGEKGMPQNDEERVVNASRMVDVALAKGIEIGDIFIDALVFPISVDAQFGNHCLTAIRLLRAKYGPAIHITGGLSNVSFGLPCRHLINNSFITLAVEAGADSGIIDPVASQMNKLFPTDRQSLPFQLAENMLLGKDRNCKNFLRAYRNGELTAK